MPGSPHSPSADAAKKRSSAPSSPVGAPSPAPATGAAPAAAASAAPQALTATGRGGGRGLKSDNGSAISSSRGGRRQVHARLHARTNSAGSAASFGAGSPTNNFAGDFARTSGGSYVLPASPLQPAERNMSARVTDAQGSSHNDSSSDDPSTHAPQHPVVDAAKEARLQREQQERWQEAEEKAARLAARKQEVASRLADPERHRRTVAAGSSNPLHVWGHETAFIKSRYFNPKRRREEKKYKSQKEQAEKFFDERMTPQTVAGGGTWSPSSSQQSSNSPRGGDHKHLLSDGSPNEKGGQGRDKIKYYGDYSANQKDNDKRGGSNNNSNNSSEDGLASDMLDGDLQKSRSSLMMKNDMWVVQEHCRTRNMNALHAFSWDQRVFLPQRQGPLSSVFDLLASPRFWEKLDWTIRGSVLTILPTLILCLEPTTRGIFPLPTSVVFLAYWTTSPTLGAGLREMFVVLKGFSISLVCLLVIIAIQPGPAWVTLIILFCLLLVTGFVAEQLKRMVAYCFASLLMAYISSPSSTDYTYVGKYYATILIGQGFGLASFMFPYIRWSSENARRYIVITGDAVSLSVHGACCSFWVENSLLERQLHVSRLRQLRSTIEASTAKAQQGLSEMGYEPHSGVYSARLKTRMAFLKNVHNVVQSMTLVIEQVAANPALVETPMCREFGERIRGELNLIGAAMDSIILRIVDLDNLVSVTDMTAFRMARTRYEEAVSTVRDEVILSNPDYRTDNSDILLGFFLFSVEELMEIIGNFQDAAKPPSNLWYFVTFPLRDLQSSVSAFVDLYHAIRIRHSITRRLKEAIKLSVCIIVAAVFQVYAMKNSSTSPVAGVDIIAFVYRATGGESFQYSTKRMLGTVLGSLTGLLSVQIAQGHRPTLYGCTLVLTFIGSYVQAAPEWGALGNALANSVISIVLNYQNAPNAITRIQQNCFAILIYFIISSLIWPVRGRTKVNTGLDVSLRMAREATDRLLRNLDLPDSATAVSADVSALLGEMQKKVGQQSANIPGAVAEPTLDSVGFPEMPWHMLVSAQRKLLVTLFMMRHAYHTFMTSTIADEAGAADKDAKKVGDNVDMIGAGPMAATSISVHWVVLHRISPYTRQLSQLFYEAMEVYLLTLSKATFVPTAELTRLRLGMMQCYDRIVAVYIETIQHELNNSDDDENDGSSDDESSSDYDDGSDDGGNNNTNHNNTTNKRSGLGKTNRRFSSTTGGGSGGVVLDGVANFMPPPASTFAPSSTTVGGTADASGDAFRNSNSSMTGNVRNGSMWGLKNKSFTAGGSGGGPSFRRTSSGGNNKNNSSSNTNNKNSTTRASSGKGGGRLSYKLTPEERQRLREYVLGPSSAGMANTSFFTRAAALAAAAEQGAATVPPPSAGVNSGIGNNQNDASNNSASRPSATSNNAAASVNANTTAAATLPNNTFANNFASNHSMFNMAGSFWNRNVSMFDPTLLRNAGIVVQEPVHEELHSRREGSESGARSSQHSTQHNSFFRWSGGGGGGRRSSGGADGAATAAANEEGTPARSAELLDDQIRPVSPSAEEPTAEQVGSVMPPLPHRIHGSGIPGSSQRSPFQHPQQPPPSAASLGTSSVDASPAGTVKRSKTAKYAMPSVLQMSMVLPAGAYALRDPEATNMLPGTASGSRLPLPSSSSNLHTGNQNPAATSPSSTNGTVSTPLPGTPPLSSTTTTGGAVASRTHNPLGGGATNQSFVSAGAGTSAAAAGDVFSLGRGARSVVRPINPWSVAGLRGGAAQRAEHDDGHERHVHLGGLGDGAGTEERMLGGGEHDVVIDSGESESSAHRGRQHADAPTAAPSIASPVTAASPHDRQRRRAADVMSNESHEPIEVEMHPDEGEAPALDAIGSGLLSDPLQQEHAMAPGDAGLPSPSASSPAALLPSPIPAPAEPQVANHSVTRPFNNTSFSAAGPAIPDALRAYVEGLAEQQRQQVPPPPAIMGNMSFINIGSNIPLANRSFMVGGGSTTGGNVLNNTFANNPAQPNSGTLSSGNIITSAGPADAATAAASQSRAATGAPANSVQADFMSAVSRLEFNNGTFCAPNRGEDRAAGGQVLLNLLDGGDVGGTSSDGGGDEYVLTNSDIHSLEAFLFGLRAIITQVEELERYLLEVVHGNEMATKL